MPIIYNFAIVNQQVTWCVEHLHFPDFGINCRTIRSLEVLIIINQDKNRKKDEA